MVINERRNFITFFPLYEDFHFFKDPGQIPFRFSKLGYSSKIISRKNGNYPLTTEKIAIEFIEKKIMFGKDISLFEYFRKNSKQIDILNVFHLDNWESLFSAFLYKFFNPKGFVYMKMDNCHNSGVYPWEKIFDNSIAGNIVNLPKETAIWKTKKYLIKYVFMNRIDLWSIEDEDSRLYFETKYKIFKNKIFVAMNGHTLDLLSKESELMNAKIAKSNFLLSVGRFGTHQKATEILLKGFAKTSEQHNWTLHLAGNVEENFKPYLLNFFNENPKLIGRITFYGNISKEELYALYAKSKILVMPSRYEGFAITFAEAMAFGNAIITTPNTSIKNILEKNDVGLLIEREDIDELGNAILSLVKNEERTKQMSQNATQFAKENLNWDEIARNIESKIIKKKNKVCC